MFTGIIQTIGEITDISQKNGGYRFVIKNQDIINNVQLGSSVCTSGVCLTVAKLNREEDVMIFDVMLETVRKTNLESKKIGDKVNLEPSLRLGDEMGGHIVFGHVDMTTKVTKITPDGDSTLMMFAIPKDIEAYIVPQGTIAIDGVSLTIARTSETEFGVSLVDYTMEHTTISKLKVGDYVNIEGDMLAKYVAKAISLQK